MKATIVDLCAILLTANLILALVFFVIKKSPEEIAFKDCLQEGHKSYICISLVHRGVDFESNYHAARETVQRVQRRSR